MDNVESKETNPSTIVREDEADDHQQDHSCVNNDEYQEILASLPKEKGWASSLLYLYQGFWCPEIHIREIISAFQCFKAHDTDLILATFPKSGTTWLKALAFAIANRERYTLSQHPLLTSNPHDLVHFFDIDCLRRELPTIQSPRIFATHVPYCSLPESVTDSRCRFIYLCRNPYDTFIFSWHFFSKLPTPDNREPQSFDHAFDMYCKGVVGYGPLWDHMLGYWKESLETPDKVLFLMYEDLKENTILHVKRLAVFMGVPFSVEEERQGVIEEIVRLCSINNLKELEVNKTGRLNAHFEKKTYFRKGEVGDWVNHLTPEMVERLSKVIKEKLDGSGLTFKTGF